MTLKQIENLLLQTGGVRLAGRVYRYFWCKRTDNPQVFVLFAEEGVGIPRYSTSEVYEWCIPSRPNRDLSIASFFKRMKLLFSKTTEGGVLPQNCASIVNDIVSEKENTMTDGCGLISRDALDFVWQSYTHAKSSASCEIRCPYSSFQGRLGPCKGEWVLDPTLEGMTILIRQSQQKFVLPMRSLQSTEVAFEEADFNNAYDTFEINSWDSEPKKGHLNIRAVQLLAKKGDNNIFDTLKGCVDQGMKDLLDLDPSGENNEEKIRDFLRIRNSSIVEQEKDGEGYRTSLLSQMADNQINADEPFCFPPLSRHIILCKTAMIFGYCPITHRCSKRTKPLSRLNPFRSLRLSS